VTICPCCGFKSANSESGVVLHHGCQACGARAVGEALPRPAHELPSYGRSLLVVVMGALMVLIFLSQTIIALVQRSILGATTKLALASIFPTDLGAWLAAAETAAWRLKWVMIPLTVLVIFASRKLYRSIGSAPSRFNGQRYARNGYLASVAVSLLVLILIGITVPVRLRHRGWGKEAETKALAYATARVLTEYQKEFGTLPSDTKDLSRLPDPDGSIAALLKEINLSEYKVRSAEVAAVPNQNPRPLRGAVIRNASLNTAADEPLSEGLSFTNYELRLPGADKLLNTEDDLIVIDGVTYRVSEVPHRVGANSAARKLQR
jgi:hypothetical protein